LKKIRLLCVTSPREDVTYQKQVEFACLGGADMIQLRDKEMPKPALIKLARELQDICKSFEVPFTINDDPSIAKEAGCDGVHIGQKDMPYSQARKILPYGIIGVSALTLKNVEEINVSGADYLGLTIFGTPSKKDAKPLGLDGLREAAKLTSIPIVAIGGIDLKSVKDVIKAGANGVAVIRAVCGAKDIKSAAKKMKDKILEAEREMI